MIPLTSKYTMNPFIKHQGIDLLKCVMNWTKIHSVQGKTTWLLGPALRYTGAGMKVEY